MKAAISTDSGRVSAHFGRCPSFTIVEVENGICTKKEEVDNPGHHVGFLPQFLSEMGVDCIIAGGMGHRAQALFDEKNIRTVMGISGTIDEVTEQICSDTLVEGESLCAPGKGRGYGIEKTECDH